MFHKIQLDDGGRWVIGNRAIQDGDPIEVCWVDGVVQKTNARVLTKPKKKEELSFDLVVFGAPMIVRVSKKSQINARFIGSA